jgi:outer membrane protein assembly factor BamB
MPKDISRLVFTGFNSRVIALDQDSGQAIWNWVSPSGSGYVSLLLKDEKHLIVSVQGYTYCLDPGTGSQLWFNKLSGFGMGVASLAAVSGQSSFVNLSAAASDKAVRDA